MKNLKYILLCLSVLAASWSMGQNISINADGSAPDNSAMLDVSSTSRGILVPRLNLTQRNAIVNPATGLLIFQTNSDSGFYYNRGTAALPNWSRLLVNNEPITSLRDLDGDTKVEVEQNSDEDLIRFGVQGTEFFRIDSARFAVLNTQNNIFIGQNSGSVYSFSNGASEPNLGIGTSALELLTYGRKNVAVGHEALQNTTDGTDNTAVGMSAARSNTDGVSNTAIGAYALSQNTTGTQNTSLGRYSLFRLDGGSENTVIGEFSAPYMTSGDANTIIGQSALENNTGSSNNTILGVQAGRNNITGGSNIFLGFRAGFNETGSDKLYIENSNSATPLIYGDFANDSLIVNGAFSINRNYTFPSASPISVGDVLQFDGSNLIWGSSAVNDLSAVLGAGKDAGADSIFNLNALSIGSTRTPLTSLEIDSSYVVMGKPFNGFRWNGYNAYYDGVSANPQFLNDGTADLFVSGSDKLILAHWNEGTANSILPNNAATSIEMDSTSVSILGEDVNFQIYLEGNVGVGTVSPLGKLEVAGDGSLIGGLRVSGTTSATVGSSIYLDAATKDWTITATNTSSGAGTDKLVFRDYSSAADRMTIDDVGNVGIGTTNPSYLLDVNGSARVDNLRVNTPNLQFGASMEVANRMNILGAGAPNIFIGNSSSNYIQLLYNSGGYGQLFTAGTNDIAIMAGGNVGIGVTNPSSELEVAGDIEIPAANDYTYSTAKTHYQSYAPTTFNSLKPQDYDFGTPNAANFYTFFINGGGGLGYSTVEVNLPDGARVGELEGWIYDNEVTSPVRVSLYRQALGSAAVSVMAQIESTTAAASTVIQNLTDNTIFNATIDNENYAYFLFFTGLDNSSNTRLYGAKLTYTVLEVD